MSQLDANGLAKCIVELGLASPQQTQDAFDEVGTRQCDPAQFLQAMERKGYLTAWQSRKLLKGDSDGFFLGGYRLLYRIASGSFGRVYRAEDPRSGRVVAIKVLRNRWMEDKKNIELFRREGRVGMQMKHPNVVEVLEVDSDPRTGQHYIVMEFVEGGNLRDFLRIRKKLSAAEALRILEDTAAGLAYAWSKGISHRDIKMTNVLISSDGTAKLVDFGLANLNEQLHKGTESIVDRTVDYAGLERATGVKPGDIRSDIYFLGCIAYELLTGRPPLSRSRSHHERMRRERFERVEPISPVEIDAPISVIHLVEKMMALDPVLRFQTPSQLLEAIRALRRGIEVSNGGNPETDDLEGKSIFIVERDLRLQDTMRSRFRAKGFRVLMASDPTRALERYQQQPFDALVVDVGTVEEDGVYYFERIMREAKSNGNPCVGVAILSRHQEDWEDRLPKGKHIAVMHRPVTIKQLQRQVEGLLRKASKKRSSR